jgi:hypothetical protein
VEGAAPTGGQGQAGGAEADEHDPGVVMTGLVAAASAGMATVATKMTTSETGTFTQNAHRQVR